MPRKCVPGAILSLDMPPSEPLTAQLLGEPRLSWMDGPVQPRSRKGSALLFLLAATPDGLSRCELNELLWGAEKTQNVRQEMFKLRRLPGAESWLREGADAHIRLEVKADLGAFEGAVQAERYEEALGFWRGPLLAGLEPPHPAYSDWLEHERRRVEALLLGALGCRASELERAGRFGDALELVRELLAHDPLDESAHRSAMRLLHRQGRIEAALAQFESCRRALASELGAEPLAETVALLTEIRTPRPVPAPAPSALTTSPLAASSRTKAPFIGREAELRELKGLLNDPDCRLLTLTGPGGIGKTRLALELAEEVAPTLGGAHVALLAPVASPELMASAIADALGLTFGDLEDSRSQLLRALSGQRALLLLDNLEHLLTGKDLLDEILTAAPGVKLLVTSRERLRLGREWLYDVQGLSYPKASHLDSYPDATGCDALRLFAARARRVRKDFRLDASATPHALRICALVQGLPLGLELAATWARVLSCEAIAAELAGSLELLGAAHENVYAGEHEARHRSLQAVFEGSWRLLAPAEQEGLIKLCVFRGSFSREAARDVAGVPLSLLLRLVDASLLSCPEPGRFELLEVVRGCALERLPEGRAATQDAHGAFYAHFLAGHEAALDSRPKTSLEAISADLENVRTAWRHLAETAQTEALEGAAKSLSSFFDLRGFFAEGAATFAEAGAALERAVRKTSEAHDKTPTLTLARLRLREGWFLFRLGRYDEVRALLEWSLDVFRRYGSEREAVSCVYQLGNVAEGVGDYAEAKRLLAESLAGYRASGLSAGVAKALNTLGLVAFAEGNYEEAKRLHEEGLPLRDPRSDPRGRVIGLNNLGDALLKLGRHAEATRLYRRALALSQEHADAWGVALSQNHLGDAAHARRDYEGAETHFREGVRRCEEIGLSYALVLALRGLGETLGARGEIDEARACLRRSLEIAMGIRARPQVLATLLAFAELLTESDPQHSLELAAFVQANASGQRHVRERAAELVADMSASGCVTNPRDPTGRLEGLVAALLAPPSLRQV